MHNNEVDLYRMLEKYNVTNVSRPKVKPHSRMKISRSLRWLMAIEVYYMREFSEHSPQEGFIVMEYVADRLPLHIYDNVTSNDILQVCVLDTVRAVTLSSKISENSPFRPSFAKIITKIALISYRNAIFCSFMGTL